MRTLKNKSLRKLSDKELLAKLEKLGVKERETMLAILLYLVEVERRSLHLKQGYGSLYEFCVNYLRYSESAAARRIRAARCLKQFPEVYDKLHSGELNLSAVSKISKILTKDNKDKLLREIVGRSSRDVDMIISRYHPKRNIRDRVRPVYVMTGVVEDGKSGKKFTADVGSKKVDTLSSSCDGQRTCKGEIGGQSAWMSMLKSKEGETGGGGPDESPPRVTLEQKYKLEFAVDPEFMATLEKLRALLSNKYPKGLDFERLFKILMDDYLDRHSPEGRIKRRKRSAKAKKSKEIKRNIEPRNKASRHIPRPIRDEVYARDGGRCTYVGLDGKRCPADKYLQIDHKIPFARGGDSSIDNLRLLCARHNNLMAERIYGKKHMEQFHRKE